MAAGFLLTMTACQKEEPLSPIGAEPQTITVTIPQNGMQTKTSAADFGKGEKIDRCILEIYRNGELYGDRQTTTVTAGKATFNLRLVASQTYDFVFWADCSEGGDDKYYDTSDGLRNITRIAGTYTGNNDEFDAFFGAERGKKVTGNFSLETTLKRPFGQLNVRTNDLNLIPDAALKPTDVKVTFSALPTSFDAMTSTVGSGTEEVSYTAPVINDQGELSIDYIWAPTDEANLADFKMEYLNNGTSITENDLFKNIPIRRNYKTNVSGNLLTKQGEINVTIDPVWDGETPVVMNGALNVTSGQEFTSLQAAIDAADEGDIIRIWGELNEDITLDKNLTIEGGSDEASASRIRTLNLSAGITATIENVQFFGACEMANSKTSVLVNNVTDVTFKNCLFAQEEAEPEMRPIETAYGFTGKLTLDGCTVKPGGSNAYFNPLSESGELVITGSTFEQIVTIDPQISTTSQTGTYQIEGNTFNEGVAMSAVSGAMDPASLSAVEKTFANGILEGNTFGDDTKRIKVFGGDNSFFVNEPAPTVYNRSTNVAYNTVSEALAAANSGETVLVSSMTCNEELTVPAGVTLDGAGTSVFTKKLSAAQGATLRNFTLESEIHRVVSITASYVVLDNLEMVYTGTESRPECVAFYESAQNVTVKNCSFTGYWKSMYVGNGAENLKIEGCTFNSTNPFSMDQWLPSLTVENNTFVNNGPMSRAIQLTVKQGTEGMAGTTKYQESWPRELQQSVYDIFARNTFENSPYMRITCQDAGWDYNSLYFSVNGFLKGALKNAQNAFTKPDRYEPSSVEFLESYEGKTQVLHYALDDRTAQNSRPNGQQTHFYNTQGRHFDVFNPELLTKWEVSGQIWVDAQMIADKKPFRSELWTAAKNASTDEDVYPMLGIANVVEDEGGIYQSTMDRAIVRIWDEENGWVNVEGVTVNSGWHTVKLVSDGNNVTYYFDDQPVGKLSSQSVPVYMTSIMPQAFHYGYKHTDGNWFYEGYSCDTYFCEINYKLTE